MVEAPSQKSVCKTLVCSSDVDQMLALLAMSFACGLLDLAQESGRLHPFFKPVTPAKLADISS